MPLKTTADALQDCADQLRQVAAGLDAAVARLYAAELEVEAELAGLAAREGCA